MWNWICPECGRENDPNAPECVGCADPQSTQKVPRRAAVAAVAAERAAIAHPVTESAVCVAEEEPVALVPVSTESALLRAARIHLEAMPAAITGHGPALVAMLQAITDEPKLLPAPVDGLAPLAIIEPAPLLCGRVSARRLRIEFRRGACDVHGRLSQPETRPAQPVIPEAEQPLAEIHTPLPVNQIILGRGPDPWDPGPAPRQPRALARARRQLAFPALPAHDESFAPAPLCGAVRMPRPEIDARPLANSGVCATNWATRNAEPAMPASLRRYLEAVVPRIAYTKRNAPEAPAERRALPAWVVSALTAAAVLLIALVAMQRFGGRAETHITHASIPPPAGPVAVSAPAWSAYPTVDRDIEVTGLRLTSDEKHNSWAFFTVVNHSSTESGALNVKVTVPSAHAGEAALCDVTGRVDGLHAWESREVRVELPRELHASDLPDWRDIHPDVHVTSAQ